MKTNKEKKSLVDAIETYRSDYFDKTHCLPSHIPVTPLEFQKIIEYISALLKESKNGDDTYFYFEDGVTILMWRGSEIYESDTAELQRNSIRNT